MKIAVVGSGISGLSAAYYLSKKHQVDLFEKEDHFGGHSHTINLTFGIKKVAVDIGFIVFNFKTYPNLIKFFNENKIEIEKSDMSFSVSVNNTKLEYCGRGLNGIFSNRSNLFNFKFLRMFSDIIKFYKKCDDLKDFDEEITLGNYLEKEKFPVTTVHTYGTHTVSISDSVCIHWQNTLYADIRPHPTANFRGFRYSSDQVLP